MYNLHTKIVTNPDKFRQLSCRDSLITILTCPLEDKYADAWSHHNYIVYVMEGRKVWHTSHGSYDLHEGDCVFVRKGACIIEQFFDASFCFIMFFVPDEFICEVLKSKSTPIYTSTQKYEPIIPIDKTPAVQAFFQSMTTHFYASHTPDSSLLELKFRELILTIADNPLNAELHAWFCALLQQPQNASLQQIMEENFCYNLKLEEFARLSARSLSAFKRDFLKVFQVPPGKWLLEKRLNHALHLLTNRSRSVAETAFESGFESPSHFSRAFRQRFGAPPATVKQQQSFQPSHVS
jgi:AraC-like DNA-binding protein